MSDILDKISKVLAQAERTDNEHEADAFFKQAQLLASRYSIDLAVARSHTAKKEQREQPVQKTITIGERGKKNLAMLVNLFLRIGRANDITCNIAHNSTYVVAFGFPSDIELTEAIYAHVSYQMVQSANAYLKKGDYKSETYFSERSWTFRPMDGRIARRSFYESFTSRIAERLNEARREAKAAAVVAEGALDEGSSSTALVLKNKIAEVEEFYGQKSNARGSWRGGYTKSASRSGRADAAGREAGSNARLSSQPALGGGHKELS